MLVECVPALSDNYIWLIHDEATGATAAIDPAEAAPVKRRLAALGWRLTHILNTHHHGDHTGGNLALKQEFGCRIIGAATDAARIPGIDDGVGDGDTVQVGSAAAAVLEVSGHTIGHIAFHFAGEHVLFCGDTLFSLGCGRMFEGNPQQFWTSLSRLRALPPDTRVYCAHEYTASNGRFARTVERGNPALLARIDKAAKLVAAGKPSLPSTIGEERAANPFLRCDIPAVARAVGLEAGADPVAVFAELRRRKDVF